MSSCCRGFTLIEVLLAIMIGALLLTSIYGIFGSVSSARNRLERDGEGYHQVRIFFDRIGGELSSLSLTPVGKLPPLRAERTLDGETVLEISTELASPFQERKGGISRVRYELRHDADKTVLYRSEQALLVDLEPSEAQPFVENVKSFQVRYYRQGNWYEQWGNASPPQLVEISIELNGDESSTPFRSSFVLPEAG